MLIWSDSSSLMTFIAEFPTIEHEEELKIEIKQAEPPKAEDLKIKFEQSNKLAKKVNRYDISERLEKLKDDIESIGSTADGRLRLMDEYRKILLDLEKSSKETEWPKIEQELKDSFYELEELIEKIKENGVDDNLNMNKISAYIEDFRKKIELIIKEKNIKEAKLLNLEIDQLDFELRNAVTGNAMDAQFLKHFNDNFNSFHWKNSSKARQLINQGMQMVNSGNTSSIRPILVELVGLLPQDEIPETLE